MAPAAHRRRPLPTRTALLNRCALLLPLSTHPRSALLGLTGDPAQDIYNDKYAALWTLKWADLIRNSSATLGAGVWLCMHVQVGRHGVGYVDTQAGMVFIITLVQGASPPESIMPGYPFLMNADLKTEQTFRHFRLNKLHDIGM